MPELIEVDLVRAGQELDLVTLDQLEIVDDQVLQIHGIRIFKEASVTFGKLEDVLLVKLEAVLFASLEIEDDYYEAVGVDQGAHQVDDKVNSVDLATLFTHQVAIADRVRGSESGVTHVNVEVGWKEIVE